MLLKNPSSRCSWGRLNICSVGSTFNSNGIFIFFFYLLLSESVSAEPACLHAFTLSSFFPTRVQDMYSPSWFQYHLWGITEAGIADFCPLPDGDFWFLLLFIIGACPACSSKAARGNTLSIFWINGGNNFNLNLPRRILSASHLLPGRFFKSQNF